MKLDSKRLLKNVRPLLIFAITMSVVAVVLVVLLIQKSNSLKTSEANQASTESSLSSIQSKMDELSGDISTLSQDNEDLRNKITDLEDQLEEATNNTSTGTYTPIPSLKSVCGDVPLPISNATQTQKDCFNSWHKKYISN